MVEFLISFFKKDGMLLSFFVITNVSLILSLFFGLYTAYDSIDNQKEKETNFSAILTIIFFGVCELGLLLELSYLSYGDNTTSSMFVVFQYYLVGLISYNLLAKYITLKEKTFIKYLLTIPSVTVVFLCTYLLFYGDQAMINDRGLIGCIIMMLPLIIYIIFRPAKYDDFRDGYVYETRYYKVSYFEESETSVPVWASKDKVYEDFIKTSLKIAFFATLLYFVQDSILLLIFIGNNMF